MSFQFSIQSDAKDQKMASTIQQKFFNLQFHLQEIKGNAITNLDLSDQKIYDFKTLGNPGDDGDSINTVTLLPNGRLVSSSHKNSAVKFWDTETGECVANLYCADPLALAVMPNGHLVIGDNKTIKIVDTKSEKTIAVLKGHKASVRHLIVWSDESIASSGTDYSYRSTLKNYDIKIWNADKKECVATLSEYRASALLALPDGRLISSKTRNFGSSDIDIWDLTKWFNKCIATLRGHKGTIYAFVLLPDGQLASGSSDYTIKLWNLQSEKCVATLEGHTDGVWGLALSADKKHLISSDSTEIRVWDIESKRCVAILPLSGSNGHLIALEDGHIAIISDGAIRLLNINSFRGLQLQDIEPLFAVLPASSVRQLNLQNSLLGDTDVPALVKLLQNTILIQLDIRNTKITKTGVQQLHENCKTLGRVVELRHEAMTEIIASGRPETLLAKLNPVKPAETKTLAASLPLVTAPTSAIVVSTPYASSAASTAVAAVSSILAVTPPPASPVLISHTASVSPELVTWMRELKHSGLELVAWQELSQQIQVWHGAGISFSVIKQAVEQIQKYLRQLDLHLAVVNQQLELDPTFQAEQAYIDQHPKLLNYQRKLQQELTKFITAYFLATTGIFKLDDNKKGMLLNIVGEVPGVSILLKLFIKGLQYANDKYRMYQINRLTELFTTIEKIEHTLLRLARQLTLAKEAEIQAQITLTSSGIADKLRGLYDSVKETLYLQWRDQKVSSDTGLTLKAEEKSALLDAAFLVEQILSGKTKLDANATRDLDVVPDFLRIVIKNPNYRHHTPAQATLSPRAASPITVVLPTPAVSPFGAIASNSSNMALPHPAVSPSPPAEPLSTKAELVIERQRREQLEQKLIGLEKAREQQQQQIAKMQKILEKLAEEKGLSVGDEQQQTYIQPELSPNQQRLGEDLQWVRQTVVQVEHQLQVVSGRVAQHDTALLQHSDWQAQRQMHLNKLHPKRS